MVSEFDFLISDVLIVDGISKQEYVGSIGISGQRIAAIGDIGGDAMRLIDGKGLTALPGFVDAHSHSDRNMLFYPETESHVMQGVATFVGGQCGSSPAPIGDCIEFARNLGPAGMDYIWELEPFMFYPARNLFPLGRVNALLKEKYGWTISWRTMGEFFQHVRKVGISMNYAPLFGHGNVRWMVLGENFKRAATQSEIEEMGELAHQAMEDGCLGMSVGMDYDPEVFADDREHIALVSIVKEYGGIWAPHWRRTGRRRPGEEAQHSRIQGIIDCLEIARKTKVRLQLAHLFGGYNVTPTPPPPIQEAVGRSTLDVIDRYRHEGLEVSFDVIPFNAMGSAQPLYSRLTPWLHLLGSKEKLVEWLGVPDFRREIRDSLSAGKLQGFNPRTNPRWGESVKVIRHRNPSYMEKTVAQIAQGLGKDPLDAFFDLIVEDPDARSWAPDYRETEDYVKVFFKHPLSMVGCDTRAYDEKRQLKSPPWSIPGINDYAAYPSFIRRYVNEQNFLTIEEAVQKTSTMPAKVYNLRDRGVLGEGAYADIVLIDQPNLRVMGDLDEPRRYPKGVEYLFVNGTIVVDRGKHTHERPGIILLRK